ARRREHFQLQQCRVRPAVRSDARHAQWPAARGRDRENDRNRAPRRALGVGILPEKLHAQSRLAGKSPDQSHGQQYTEISASERTVAGTETPPVESAVVVAAGGWRQRTVVAGGAGGGQLQAP